MLTFSIMQVEANILDLESGIKLEGQSSNALSSTNEVALKAESLINAEAEAEAGFLLRLKESVTSMLRNIRISIEGNTENEQAEHNTELNITSEQEAIINSEASPDNETILKTSLSIETDAGIKETIQDKMREMWDSLVKALGGIFVRSETEIDIKS
jgi:hypothetical protein